MPSRLEPLQAPLGSPEHLAWMEQSAALQKAYRKRQRAYKRSINLAWPYRVAVDVRPHPGLIDTDDPEG